MKRLISGWLCCPRFPHEGGRKNQFKCLIPTEDSFCWVTHHALRNFRAFGGDE